MPYLFNHRPRTSRSGAWSEEDDQTLRASYASTSAYAIGKKLGRSESAVWLRASALGLGKRQEAHHPWSSEELSDLELNYATQSASVIAKRLGRTETAVAQQGRALGLESRKTLIGRSVAADYFRKIDSVEQAYILGLLAADGNVGDDGGITLGLQAKDEHLLRFVHGVLAPKHAISVAKTGFTAFTFTSHEMAADLAQWGIVPRKSRVITWPAGLAELQRPFLLGYFDGDGCAYIARNGDNCYPGWSVCSGSGPFLADLKEYVRAATGVELGKIQRRRNASLYEVGTSGSGAHAVDEWLHRDGLGLARKRFPAHVLERYQVAATEGRTRNGVASRYYSAEFKAAAVDALRQVRQGSGVVYGDVKRVADQLGVYPGNLRAWVKKTDQV